MKAFTSITPAYEKLCNACLVASWERTNPTVPLEIIVDEYEESDGNADFRSAGFDNHVANKMLIIADLAATEQAPFLITDADVFYFKPVASCLDQMMGSSLDLLIARDRIDSDKFNIGQMLVRPSPITASFFNSVAAVLQSGFSRGRQGAANQDCLVNILKSTDHLTWRPLPPLFANTPIDAGLNYDLRRQLFSLHLTHTWVREGKSSLEQKWELLHKVIDSHPANPIAEK